MYQPEIGKHLEIFKKSADNENGMFSKELTELLYQVIKSWQVIAVTLALIFYMYLVSYAARRYRRPRSVSKSKPQKVKPAPKAAITEESEESIPLE